MEIFNNYLMYKLLFDDKNLAKQKQPKGSKWRGSCLDVSQTRQPLRARLTRRRSGSWNGPISIEEKDIEEDVVTKKVYRRMREKELLTLEQKPSLRCVGRFATFAEHKQSSQEQTPEIQITPVEKTVDFLSVTPLEKVKTKLARKRSGSLPESRVVNEGDKNKLAPPQRYEAPATLDPKRKNSEPYSSQSSLGSGATGTHPSIPPSIPDNILISAVSAENSPQVWQESQQPFVTGPVQPDAPLSPVTTNTLNTSASANAVSSPSLLDLYISLSRGQSVDEDYNKMMEEIDSVVLDLGYRYNKPVQYAHSAPISDKESVDPCQKTVAYSQQSLPSHVENIEPVPLCTPPPSRAVSREASKAVYTGSVKRNPLIEAVRRKLRALKQARPRTRSAGYVQDQGQHVRKTTEVTPRRWRWRLSRSKSPKKLSPPSIFIENMVGSGENSVPLDKPKTSGVWHPPTVRPFERTLSYKRSTSAPSPRFSTGREKSNACDYGVPIKKTSVPKNVYDIQHVEALASDPINDFIETKTTRKLLTRTYSPLLQPGWSNVVKLWN